MPIKLGNNTSGPIYLGSSEINFIQLGTTNVYSNSISASGGETGSFTSGSVVYKWHKFTDPTSSFEVVSENNASANILVVGGGAGGDSLLRGPGGGGVLYSSSVVINSGSYTILVGRGGNNTGSVDANGQNSYITSSTLSLAAGGGYTRELAGTPATYAGQSGFPQNNLGGIGNYPSPSGYTRGGGGGGAGANGTNANTSGRAGSGGDGLSFNMTGTVILYGAGGGGGATDTLGGTRGGGGTTGGGFGNYFQSEPNDLPDTNGLNYVGAAGGGGPTGSAGFGGASMGGHGVVIINYKIGLA
jgi:hypothetical protein